MVIDKPDDLKPHDLLKAEHKVIARMIKLMKGQLDKVTEKKKADPSFIDAAVEFFTVYADKCHHDKEENIYFYWIKRKNLSPAHKKLMSKLIAQHVFVRQTTDNLMKAKKSYVKGDEKALKEISHNIRALVNMYPEHMEQEEHQFFEPAEEYFSEEELNKMLKEFHLHDRDLLHEKYIEMVDELEN
jgi:hemerythrin-like domain-containing protein